MPGRVDMMYTHALDPLKGWFQLSALDKSAAFDPTILSTGQIVYPGRVVYVNDAGYFTADRRSNATTLPGGTVTCYKTAMPMFLWAGTGDADVFNDGTSASSSSVTNWTAIMPAGVSMALVATGGYELQTTEFYSSASSSFVVNRPVSSITSSNTAQRGTATTVGAFSVYPNVGLLTTDADDGAVIAAYTDQIVGICSAFTQGQVNYLQPTNLTNSTTNTATGYNAHGMTVLSFYTYFLPEA